MLSEKNKEISLLGDFNTDLLKYKKGHNTVDFLDQMYSISLVPHITSTRIISENTMSENTVTPISDYLAQF